MNKNQEPSLPKELRSDLFQAMLHQLAIIEHATLTRKRLQKIKKDCAKLKTTAKGDALTCSKTLAVAVDEWDKSLDLAGTEASLACKCLGRMAAK